MNGHMEDFWDGAMGLLWLGNSPSNDDALYCSVSHRQVGKRGL